MPKLTSSGRVRFGVFEIDLVSGELRKRGMKVKLHDQPFKVLAMLVERPGEVITREEFREVLWSGDTFVDWDLGLNSAIMKLRAALGDSAENPRFIETLPRRGYRLIIPVEPIGAAQDADLLDSSSPDGPGLPNTDGEYSRVALSGQTGLLVAEPGPTLETMPSAGPAEELARRRRPGWLRASLIATALVAIGLGLWHWFGPRRAGEGSLAQPRYVIAVLPLKNLSSEPESDYFSDGLTDEIISDLSVIDGLQVKSQTSSFAFKDKPLDIRAVASQLGANLILEGSVLRAGDRLRVNVQLVRVSDDNPLWSGRFERELKDIFAVQDEISLSIVNELRLNLGQGRRRYNTNLEAYDLYLKARALASLGPGSKATIAASIPVFEAAIARDPNFAPAYAGIADAYAYLSASPRALSSEVAYANMRPACEKAMALDPLLAEAYACMGLLNSRDFMWSQAESDFRKAFELNPSLARPHSDYAMMVLFPMGKLTEAERQSRLAIQLDPLSTAWKNALNMILQCEGKYDEVLENSRSILALNPADGGLAQQIYARALMQRGRVDEAVPILEKAGKGSESWLGYGYAKQGRRADAEQIAAQHKDWPWTQAIVSAGLGDKEGTLAGLQGMAAIKDPRVGMYPQYPELALVRGDPRIIQMRKVLGLPEIR